MEDILNACGLVKPRVFVGENNRSSYKGEFKEFEPQGKAELEILCPVSKLTGFPMSMQQAITMITDKNSRIAEALCEFIPPIKADNTISDDDKMKMLLSRLDSGSFYENDRAAEILADIAKEFFPAADVEKVVSDVQAKINFESTEVPSSES